MKTSWEFQQLGTILFYYIFCYLFNIDIKNYTHNL